MNDLEVPQGVKSFWQRREGTAGKATLVVGVGAAAYGLAVVGPTLLVAAATAVYAYTMIACVVGTLALISYKPFRMVMSNIFKGVMHGLFAIDPVLIIRGHIETLNKRLGVMDERIIDVKKQTRNLQQVMDLNEREMQNELALAKQCQANPNEFNLHMAAAGRLKRSTGDLKVSWQQLDTAYRVLTCMRERAVIEIKDKQNAVSVQERQRKAIKSGNSAFRSAMSIIQGDANERYMVDSALERLADEIGESIGEMDHFMEISSTILRSADLQKSVDRDEGLKMLEEWSKRPSLLLGSEKTILLSAAPGDAATVRATPVKSDWNSIIDSH